MKLERLLQGLAVQDFSGDPGVEILDVAYDSRKVRQGTLFFAIRGHHQDGHDYVPDAVGKGAAALVVESLEKIPPGVPVVTVQDSRQALWRVAANFYQEPYRKLNLIGITGTNGKTTTSFLLESILKAAGRCPGVIGTISYRYDEQSVPAPMTTPQSLDLLRMLREMADHGVTDVVMEVSSHALDQRRTGDCPFRVGIFTNFSRDHLDYHRTMDSYFEAKSTLFRCLGQGNGPGREETAAVINMDDPKGAVLEALTGARIFSYGLGGNCSIRARALRITRDGLQAELITPNGRREIRSRLIGEVNVYNILAAAAAAISLGIDLDTAVQGIQTLEGVPGRLERVPNPSGSGPAVIVDYAHTPDALLKSMRALKPLTGGRLITVFGCGGDRDKGKRKQMGLLAGENSHIVMITSDNPRSEDPAAVMEEIEQGVRESGLSRLDRDGMHSPVCKGYLLETDRRKAIRTALSLADSDDLVLIAGKGHENYQIVGKEIRHFDDREEASFALKKIGTEVRKPR